MCDTETPKAYCLDELQKSAKILSRIGSELPSSRKRYDHRAAEGHGNDAMEELADLKWLVERMWSTLLTVIQLLNEAGESALANTAKQFRKVLLNYDYLGVPSYKPLCSAIRSFVAQIASADDNINKAKLGRLMNRVMSGYYPTDLDHVEYIKQALVFPDCTVNIFDPCCGEGYALARLAAGKNACTYGIEIDDSRAEVATEKLDRVGFGSFFFSRISQNVFHCLFLNPPYLSVPSELGTRRLEKAFLADSMCHLMYGGLLVYIIPYYRLTEDVASALADNFDHLQIYRFCQSEFQRYQQIAVLGIRKKRDPFKGAPQDSVTRLITDAMEPDHLPTLDTLPPQSIALPEQQKQVELFKGGEFNIRELEEQLKQSKSLKQLYQTSALNKRAHRPLLPLNPSHLGIVGASGYLNGLVPGKAPHLIKGKIEKKILTRCDMDTMEITQTVSNQISFACLTQSGGLKNLV